MIHHHPGCVQEVFMEEVAAEMQDVSQEESSGVHKIGGKRLPSSKMGNLKFICKVKKWMTSRWKSGVLGPLIILRNSRCHYMLHYYLFTLLLYSLLSNSQAFLQLDPAPNLPQLTSYN